MVAVRFFSNVDYDALHMHTGSLKINIFIVVSVLVTKSTLCTLLIMLTISFMGLVSKLWYSGVPSGI